MHRVRVLSLVSFAAFVGAAAGPTRGQTRDDVFDQRNGGEVTSSSGFDSNFPGGNLNGGGLAAAIFRDSNGPAGTVDDARVAPHFDFKVRLSGVTVYTLADGGVEDGVRGVSNFRLLGHTQGRFSLPDVVLIDGVNPRDDGSPNAYTFPDVTVYEITAEFTRSTDFGPRVVELDGFGQLVPIPEPSSAAVTALVANGALLLRRRRAR